MRERCRGTLHSQYQNEAKRQYYINILSWEHYRLIVETISRKKAVEVHVGGSRTLTL